MEKITLGVSDTTDLANAINHSLSATGNTWVVDDYSVVPTVETPDNVAALTALFGWVSNGDTVKFGNSKEYHITDTVFIDLSRKSINVDLNNSTLIVHDTFSKGLIFHGGWASNQEFTLLKGNVVSGIPDTSLIRPRDMVRLFSDDAALDARGESAFQSEDIYVERIIDENSIELGGRSLSVKGPNVPYVTNPRIAQRNRTTVNVYNGNIQHKDGQTNLNHVNAPLVQLVAMNHPKINNVNVPRSYRWGIELVACLYSSVTDCDYSNFDNRDMAGDQDVFGTGLMDCSYSTRVYNVTGTRTRHLIDTHCQVYGSNPTRPELYGSSTDMKCYGCTSFYSTGDSFGAHHQCRGLVYNSCISRNSLAYGFQARGEVELINCSSVDCVKDINIFDEDDLLPSRTKAVIRGHKNVRSGVITNSNQVTPVDFYDYTGDSVITAGGTGFYSSGRSNSLTRFHGHTKVNFDEPRDLYNACFGTNVQGTIEFDTMEFIYGPWEGSYYGIDIRGVDVHNNFTLRGNTLIIPPTGVRSIFTGSSAKPVREDQLRFNLVCDGWEAKGGIAKITKLGDLQYLKNINILNANERVNGERLIKGVVNFGSAVGKGDIVSGTIPAQGLAASHAHLLDVVPNVEGCSIISCMVTADGEITVTLESKAEQVRDLSAISITVRCKAS